MLNGAVAGRAPGPGPGAGVGTGLGAGTVKLGLGPSRATRFHSHKELFDIRALHPRHGTAIAHETVRLGVGGAQSRPNMLTPSNRQRGSGAHGKKWAKGYVRKEHAKKDLLPAIEAVLRGDRFVSRGLHTEKLPHANSQYVLGWV